MARRIASQNKKHTDCATAATMKEFRLKRKIGSVVAAAVVARATWVLRCLQLLISRVHRLQ